MKAIFIAFNQAYNDEIVDILTRHGQRGYSRWDAMGGRGGVNGEPHLGSHAWPVMNISVLTVVEDALVEPILKDLHSTDEATPDLGLRAFVWNVETMV